MVDTDLNLLLHYKLVPDNVNDPIGRDALNQRIASGDEQAQKGTDAQTSAAKAKSREGWDTFMRMYHKDTSDLEGNEKTKAEMTKFVSQQFEKVTGILKKSLTMSFDVTDRIYKEVKKSSPLLETLETLFNLAMQLFFMPLGNKLGEILIPAVVEMLDSVVSLWSDLGNGKLGDIFDRAFQKGVTILGNLFKQAGTYLKDQGGILGKMGSLLETLGNFIQNHGWTILNSILSITQFILENIKGIITAIIAFKVASLTMQALTIYAIAVKGLPGAAIGVATTAAVITAGLTSYGVNNLIGQESGGYVPATDGGALRKVAENGEGEYIIPESQLSAFKSSAVSPKYNSVSNSSSTGNTYNITITGLTTDELKSYIKDVISEQISQSKLRSGY